MHGSVLGFFAYGALQAGEVAGRDVLEVGSLDVNGSVRPMVEARGSRSYVGVDVVQGPGVDRVVDAADLEATFGRDAFDVVVSTECLEHVEDWRIAIANMVAVLRPGGVLVWTTRSPGFAYHHPPDRWRYTQTAMAEILETLDLEAALVADDPEYPGVFCKARKPGHGRWGDGWHADYMRWLLRHVSGVTAMAEPRKWLGLPANPDGAGYYRMWQPWTQLQRHSGHEVLIPPPGAHAGISLNEDEIAAFDLLAQQRPNGRGTLRDWRRWQGRTELVYEADDNLLEPDTSGLPAWLDDTIQDTVTECLRMASLVTVSTEPLAEVFRPHNPNVAVLPNCVHEDMLTIGQPDRGQPVTIGWAGGATHLQDIALIQEPLTTILDETAAGLHFLGMDYRSLFAGRGRWTNWQPDIWDYYQAVDFDIALCPLEPTAFNACRTPIKALEMAALGIPVLASDTTPYREFVVDGVTGYLCRTPADWRARLRELVNDPQARQELGAKARQLAADHTIQQHYRRWQTAYEGVGA